MITTSPARDNEELRMVMINLFSNIFGNQLVIGDIHAPMNKVSDIFAIKDGNQVIGGWSIFRAFSPPSLGIPVDPTGWEAIAGMLSMLPDAEYILPFPVESENDHGKRPWDEWDFRTEYLYTDIAMRISTKDIEVRDISELPPIRAAIPDDADALESYYKSIGDTFQGVFHPLQLESDNYVICESDGSIIGAAGTHFETPYTVQLGNIHVQEEYRGKGIGRALTTAVTLGAIKTKRVPTLFVNQENRTAIELYESIGFERYNSYEFHRIRVK
ncbi:MAG: GNAT family N-acetyltransferase [Candidatus Kariarchaeaceae archaeon]|jgi:ribosomal protein S18 acetylase RimI-like enzyme